MFASVTPAASCTGARKQPLLDESSAEEPRLTCPLVTACFASLENLNQDVFSHDKSPNFYCQLVTANTAWRSPPQLFYPTCSFNSQWVPPRRPIATPFIQTTVSQPSRRTRVEATSQLFHGPYPVYSYAHPTGATSMIYDNLFSLRPKLPRFYGDPLVFAALISVFEAHVESRVTNQKVRFCLLLRHCVDYVKERIQRLGRGGELCYRLAKERLLKEYGSSWVALHLCEQRIKNFPNVKPNDAEEIKKFSELLKKTLVTVDIR